MFTDTHTQQLIAMVRRIILEGAELTTELESQIAALVATILTTRGDLLYRNATTAARLAKGAQNTILSAGADDPAWSTLSALLDAVVGSGRGSILHRGETLWGALAPGTSGHYLKSNGTGADLSYAAVPTPPTWELIEARTVDGDEAFTGLGGYEEVLFVLEGVTASGAGQRAFRVSSDNGSNYLSGASDYAIFTGTSSTATTFGSLTSDNSGAARDATLQFPGFNLGSTKKVAITTNGRVIPNMTAAYNAVLLFSTVGNLSGGTIHVFAK